ncbi:hypothetical protein NCC49_000298 [Naganishia albida]|nr:hypothetical protein NCC49_000298 [Naganishia albida]
MEGHLQEDIILLLWDRLILAIIISRNTEDISTINMVLPITNPGIIAINTRLAAAAVSLTAQAPGINSMVTPDLAMGITGCLTEHTALTTDTVTLGDMGQASKYSLQTRPTHLEPWCTCSKHHATLMDKIEGKIEMKVGEKVHNPAMVAHGKAKYKGYSK